MDILIQKLLSKIQLPSQGNGSRKRNLKGTNQRVPRTTDGCSSNNWDINPILAKIFNLKHQLETKAKI